MSNNTPEIKIVGPFSSEYSLAKVNREFATALDKFTDKYKISLFADDSSTDKLPTSKEYSKYPQLKKLFKKEDSHSKIAIYNNFPKSFPQSFELNKIDADIKMVYLAWEETGFPTSIAMEFNEELCGVMVTSEHVAAVLKEAGVKIPIVNIGEGLDKEEVKVENYKLKTQKSFKFLHVSSGLPRKGVDVLLKAYFEEFTKEDDVTLVIKTYHNESNEIPGLLEGLRKENSPEVEVIYDLELTEGQMASLYQQADAVVLPSRAEGFGLPQGEAMHFGVPLITTAYSGHTDFVNKENAWLLDYELVQADSQLALMNSFWAEPEIEQLKHFMRNLFENIDNDSIKAKIQLAKETVSRMTWEKTAIKALEFIKEVEQFSELKTQKLAIISPINSKGGIEEYSRDLYKPISRSFNEVKFFANDDAEIIFKDNSQVIRTWEQGESDFVKTIKEVKSYKPDIIHIQYNSPFYSLEAMKSLVRGIKNEKNKVFLTIHSLPNADFGMYRDSFETIEKIFVHSSRHLEVLKDSGYKNIFLFNHGIVKFLDEEKTRLRKKLNLKGLPIIASHGLIHDKKGLLETLEAISLLKKDYPEIRYLSINAVNTNNITSANISERMDLLIEKLNLEDNVIRITEFLEVSEIIKLLHLSDIVVLPYSDLDEGASGAVRFAFASLRPVIRTKSSIFTELGDVGFQIDNNKPKNIAKAVVDLFENKELYNNEIAKNKDFVEKNSWDIQGRKYLLEISS